MLAALANTIKLSPEVVEQDVAARDAEFARLTKAVAHGYAKGERAQVYAHSDSGVRNEFSGGRVQLVAYMNTSIAAFLPGGFEVTAPDGKVTLSKFGKVAGEQRSLTHNNETSGKFRV